MKPLTIAFVTSRENPNLYWFLSSLWLQIPREMDKQIHLILIDLKKYSRKEAPAIPIGLYAHLGSFQWEMPKPNVWQGDHRLTKRDCWDAGSARNTALCLCKTEWIAFLDDRCVLQPGWLNAIGHGMDGGYAVFGAYEKRHGLTVKDGVIQDYGKLDGEDCREVWAKKELIDMPFKCHGEWSYGCNLAFPLEWALEVNGYDEHYCGGAGFEDCWLGVMMANNGKDVRYDYRMKVIQDRTPSELGEAIFKRDKGESPNDKSHEIVKRLKDLKAAPNPFNIRELRATIQAGGKFPIPTGPTVDWYDGQPLTEYA